MSRRLKSPTRTISNRGDHPRFVGIFHSKKSTRQPSVFDSISSLFCAIYLDWRRDVVTFEFEAQKISFLTPGSPKETSCIPDYEVVFDTGEVGYVDAKYDPDAMRDTERLKLAAFSAHCQREGIRHEVVFRSELEQDGFIQTIQLLRRYATLEFPSRTLRRVVDEFSGHPEANIIEWQKRTRGSALPLAAVYRLLYEGALPLRFGPLLNSELQQWLG